jgi:hypothetical protein
MGRSASFACECGSEAVTVFGSETTSAIVTCSKCQRVIGGWNDYLSKVSPAATVVWNIQAGAPLQDADNYAGQVGTGNSARKPSTLG